MRFREFVRPITWSIVAFLVLASDAGATSLLVSSRAGGGGVNGVLRYDAETGAFLGVFASHPDLTNPMGLAIGPDGNLYVSQHGLGAIGGKIMRFDGQSGAFIDTFIEGGLLEAPLDLTFGADGNLYVGSHGNNLILAYGGATGAEIGIFGDASGTSGLADPWSLTFGPDGNLYVSTYEKDRPIESLSAVLRYDASGASLPSPLWPTGARFGDPDVVAPPAGFPDLSLEDHILPVDLSLGPDGDLYVLSIAGDGVLRFDAGTGGVVPA